MRLVYGWQKGKFTIGVVNKLGLRIVGPISITMEEAKQVRESMAYGQPDTLQEIKGHEHESPIAGRDGLNEIDHLLICLEEECLEVGLAVSKALRFGLDDNFTDTTPREMIKRELNDIAGVISLLAERDVLPAGHDPELVQAKREKLSKMLAYAREKGTLRTETAARQVELRSSLNVKERRQFISRAEDVPDST